MAGLFLIACSSQKLEQSNNSNINANVEAEQKVAVSNGTSLEQKVTVSNEASSERNVTTPISEEEMNMFEKEVAAIEEKVENSAANGTYEENKASYLTIDQELERIEDKLDLFDDELEANYLDGTILAEQYREKELQLDQLENRLELAENTLEVKYGIDD